MESKFESNLAEFLDLSEQEDIKNNSNNSEAIYTKEEANYYIRKVKELNLELSEIDNTADAEIKKQTERINKWRETVSSNPKYLKEYYTSMLREFWNNFGNNKTLKLSNGSIGSRKIRDKTEFDKDTVYKYLQSQKLDSYFTKEVFDDCLFKSNLTKDDNDVFYFTVNDKQYPITEGINVIHQENKFEVK